MPAKPVEFANVIILAKHFLAIHTKDKDHIVISQHPETDMKIAQLTARIFAENNHIPYDYNLREPQPFIVTVLKKGEQWFPGKVNAEKFTLMTGVNNGAIKFGCDRQEDAIEIAELLASQLGAECIPAIGIALIKAQASALASSQTLL